MALGTYGVVILAALLLSRLGLGTMSAVQWLLFVGLAVLLNAAFFVLFASGANLRFVDPSLTRLQIVASALWGTVPLWALPQARPIVLMFYLPAFSFGMLRFDRRGYFRVVAIILAIYAGLLGLEYATGRAGFRLGYEFFLFALFGLLLSWFAFFGGFVSGLKRRLREQRLVVERANDELRSEVAARIRTAEENRQLIAELRDSLGKVKTLSGLLPICASCKKIRDDHGYWKQIEAYLSSHSEAEFTHGICPDCAARLFPGIEYPDPSR